MLSRGYYYMGLFGFLAIAGISLAGADSTAGSAASSAEAAVPVAVGTALPAVDVMTSAGETVKLNEAFKDQAVAIVFYRGHWCPYCMKHLKQLQEATSELDAAGVKLVAITTDKPEIAAETRKKDFDFDIYSDSGLDAAKAMGVAFQLDPKTAERFKETLVENTGKDTGQLPVPAIFLVDKAGVIQFVYSNPDYKVRLSNEELLAAVKKMQG